MLAAALLLAACSPKVYPVERICDSVRVEYRERLVLDTVTVSVPEVSERTVTRDTVSALENEWARSEAAIDADGLLHHSLMTKPRDLKIPVSVPVRDTVYEEKRSGILIETRYVEMPPTAMDTFLRKSGIALWVIVALALVALVLGIALKGSGSGITSLFKRIKNII